METKQLVAIGVMAALILTGGKDGPAGKVIASSFKPKIVGPGEPDDPNPYSKNNGWTLTDVIWGLRQNASYLATKFKDNKKLVSFVMDMIYGDKVSAGTAAIEFIVGKENVEEIMDFIMGGGDWTE